MKKLIVMIALVVGATTFAQERKAMHAEKKVEKLTKELDLTQEQQEKVKVLFEKKGNEQQVIRAEKMDVKKAENSEFDKEIRAILTPEQTKKWEAKKADQKRKMSDKRHDKKSDLKERK